MGSYLAPNGEVVVIDDPALAQRAVDTGYKAITAQSAGPALTQQATADQGAATAALTAGLSGLTLGASDALLAGVGDKGTTRALRETREAHPVASAIGTGIGALAPAVLSGGESLLNAPSQIGRAVAGAAERGGLGRLGGAIAGGAAEGGIYGAGNAVSELALQDDPLTMERVASSLSSNLLFGAATGGVLGGAFNVAERGLSRAKGAIDDALERSAAKARVLTPADAAGVEDVATLDKTSLKAAREAELDAIDQALAPKRDEFVDALKASHEASDAEKVWLFAKDHPNKYVNELAAVSYRVNKGIRRQLDNIEGLKANPSRVLGLLQEEDQMLARMELALPNDLKEFQRGFDLAPGEIRADIVGNRVPGFVVGKGGLRADSPLIDKEVERQMLERYGSMDAPQLPTNLRVAYEHLGEARFRNKELRNQLATLTAEPTSERLDAIDNAMDVLRMPKEKESSAAKKLLHAIPVVGRIAEVADTGSGALAGLKLAAGGAARKTAQLTSKVLGAAERGAKVVPPLATKVLASVRFAPRDERKAEPDPTSLAGLYKARTDEIKSQTAYDANGTPRLRPEARAKMAAQLRGLRATDPIAADRIETLAARRIEYLSALIPRRPDFGTPNFGNDGYKPSDLEMRSYARSIAAAEDPSGVEERVINGTVTPEDAAAYWAIYPERGQHFKMQYLNAVSGKAERPSLRQRIAFGMFAGVPVDPSMHPTVLAALQAPFAAEPGTEGGTQAPKASPQFGSIKKSPDAPTPAQTRAQGGMT